MNEHTWDDASHFTTCPHLPLSSTDKRNKKWLRKGLPAHKALTQVVLDKRLFNDVGSLNLFCHTGDLEVYHSSMTKYCPKREHFPFKGMWARSCLAA